MSDHTALARWEAEAELFFRRFGRLAPGKSEAAATGRDSCDPENVAQHKAWRGSHQSCEDAIDRVLDLEQELARLRADVARLTEERDEARERHRLYSEGIRHAIGDDYRLKTDSGEPAFSDWREIGEMKLALASLRKRIEEGARAWAVVRLDEPGVGKETKVAWGGEHVARVWATACDYPTAVRVVRIVPDSEVTP